MRQFCFVIVVLAVSANGFVASATPVEQTGQERAAHALGEKSSQQSAFAQEQIARDNFQVQQDMARSASRMFVVAGIEAVITLIGVVLVGLTLAATSRAVGEAKRAADAGYEMVKQSKHNARQELRAYIGASSDEIDTTEGECSVSIMWKNFGQTPAYNTHIAAACQWFQEPRGYWSIVTSSTKVLRLGVIQPGEKVEALVISDLLTDDQIRAIENRTGALTLWAEARYQDAFDEWHVTRLYQEIAQPYALEMRKFVFCNNGNESN